MQRFFIPAAAMAALFFTGCMMPETHREDALAAIVTVDRYQNQPNLFLVAMTVYEEDGGKVLAMPKVALEFGLPAMVRLQEPAAPALPKTIFYPVTTAPTIDSVMNGTQVALIVTPRDNGQDKIELKFSVLSQDAEDAHIKLHSLTPPAIAVQLGQPLLILKRADGYMALVLDPASPESLAQARFWSPAFPGLPASAPIPIPPSAQ